MLSAVGIPVPSFNASSTINFRARLVFPVPGGLVYKGTANSSAEVEAVMKAANNDEKCVGIIIVTL